MKCASSWKCNKLIFLSFTNVLCYCGQFHRLEAKMLQASYDTAMRVTWLLPVKLTNEF